MTAGYSISVTLVGAINNKRHRRMVVRESTL